MSMDRNRRIAARTGFSFGLESPSAGTLLLSLAGESGVFPYESVNRSVREALGGSARRLVVDLSGVSCSDSGDYETDILLYALSRFRRLTEARGGNMALLSPSPVVGEMLRKVGLEGSVSAASA